MAKTKIPSGECEIVPLALCIDKFKTQLGLCYYNESCPCVIPHALPIHKDLKSMYSFGK